MPYAPGRKCPGRGPRRGSCSGKIYGKEGCCADCMPFEKQANKRYDESRGNSGERGYDNQWQKVREMKASQDPVCESCLIETGDVIPVEVVHHIKPIDTHPELRLDMDNLISLCVSHHEVIHGKRMK